MITVRLDQLHFTGFHGIHEEERILGNEYIVDISVDFEESREVISHIHDTVNYATIFRIIKDRISVPTPLLETIVMEAGNEIYREFPYLASISISIRKMHPPIAGMQGTAGVCWKKDFHARSR